VISPLGANSQTTAFGSDDVRHLPTISLEGPPQAARTDNKTALINNRNEGRLKLRDITARNVPTKLLLLRLFF
jgi:hypothetical protein